MRFAPIGIFALIVSTIGEYGIDGIIPLHSYLIVYAGAALSVLIIWQIISNTYYGVSILSLTKKMTHLSGLALTVTSSAITLSTAIEDTEVKLGIKREVLG